MSVLDLTGKVFGRLTAISYRLVLSGKCRRAVWMCNCSCGNTKEIFSGSLTSGVTKSCGCYIKEIVGRHMITHGESRGPKRTVEYPIWYGMLGRCYSPGANRYERYGGRGITVCDRWRGRDGYANFISDVGRRPGLGYSLDRFPDNNGNYEPGNVRWATREQQDNHTSKSRFVTFDDRTMTIAQWSRERGIHPATLQSRLGKFPVHVAMTPGPLPQYGNERLPRGDGK